MGQSGARAALAALLLLAFTSCGVPAAARFSLSRLEDADAGLDIYDGAAVASSVHGRGQVRATLCACPSLTAPVVRVVARGGPAIARTLQCHARQV